MEGNPTGCMGLPDYLGWKWKSVAGIPIVCVPGCPVQPDNFMETLLYLLYMAGKRAPMIPLDEALRPTWLFGNTLHEGCDRGGYYEQGQFGEEYGSPQLHRETGMLGPSGSMQRWQTRVDGWDWWLSQCRWHLHRLYHARLPRQVYALHESATWVATIFRCGSNLWPGHPRAPQVHASVAEQRTRLAP
jgi:hypothetical protein